METNGTFETDRTIAHGGALRTVQRDLGPPGVPAHVLRQEKSNGEDGRSDVQGQNRDV